MKGYLIQFLVLSISLSTVLTSCKKEETASSTTSSSATKTDHLAGKSWVLKSAKIAPTFTQAGITIDDLYKTMDACDKDNTMTFKTDKTFVTDEGATKCDPKAPQTETGTWALIDSETKIQTVQGKKTTTLNLISVSNTSLVVTYTLDIFPDKKTRTVTNEFVPK